MLKNKRKEPSNDLNIGMAFMRIEPLPQVSAATKEEAVAKAVAKYNLPESQLILSQDGDVLDTWFSSGKALDETKCPKLILLLWE